MPTKYIQGYIQIELGTVLDGKILHTYYIHIRDDVIEKLQKYVHEIDWDTFNYFFQEYNCWDGGALYN